MGSNLVTAIALMLVIEGILPFAAPAIWREAVRKIASLNDGQLRLFGLIFMLSGLILLFSARWSN